MLRLSETQRFYKRIRRIVHTPYATKITNGICQFVHHSLGYFRTGCAYRRDLPTVCPHFHSVTDRIVHM